MIERALPYIISFIGALVISLVLTPLVREMNRRLGMVDKPDPRRINKTPIPRGGGLAIVVSLTVMSLLGDGFDIRLVVLGALIAAIGFVDDRFSLRPIAKLAGQLIVAFLVWSWVDLGFKDLWPWIPMWLDCILTVFWIVGAVNAFNLIDGLDGLAAGLALIATIGMAGTTVFLGQTAEIVVHLAFAGALLGFLRYNYNPASVFLGDCGSMFIGFVLSVMPLKVHTPNSFLVSVGVPMLAMGVPIFDTALAIARRSIRHLLRREGGRNVGNDEVMTADTEHVHHRLLRSVGLNQRKAAWILYAFAFALVATGLIGMNLRSHRAGLWLIAVTVAAVVVFRDISRVELYEAGRLLGDMAHNRKFTSQKRITRLVTPALVAFDVASLVAIFFLVSWVTNKPFSRIELMVALPIRVFSTFVCLVFFKAYVTVWSRAMLSNYVRIIVACLFGSIAGSVGIYYAPEVSIQHLRASTILYAVLPALAVVIIRTIRSVVRDLYYALDCRRIADDTKIERILVYGCGLRYRAFRRELVRSTAANNRLIMGLIDDDVCLRGRYIGGIRVLGTLSEAPEIIRRMKIDAVVIACEIPDKWLETIKTQLLPTGVRLTHFTFGETPVAAI